MTVSSWHQLCTLREDVRTGRLTLDEFAADLNGVRTGEAPPVYHEATLFFSRTYPTYRMKQLVRDVLLRLAGQGGKPVQQLQVAYGGGKTHTLITLLHLAEGRFPWSDSPSPTDREREPGGEGTVSEFVTFSGLARLPRARVALLPFDKFDVKEGLEVYGPDRRIRRVLVACSPHDAHAAFADHALEAEAIGQAVPWRKARRGEVPRDVELGRLQRERRRRGGCDHREQLEACRARVEMALDGGALLLRHPMLEQREDVVLVEVLHRP